MAIDRVLADLEWLAERSRRVLEDPKKQKWHEDTRTQLAQIEAEMERLKSRELSREKEEAAQHAPH